MTYKQLLEELQTLTPEQLEATVTINVPYEHVRRAEPLDDEYIAVVHSNIAEEGLVGLDPGHYYLVLKA